MNKYWFFCSIKDFNEKLYKEGKVPVPASKEWKEKGMVHLNELKRGDIIVVYSASNSTENVRVFGIAEWISNDIKDNCFDVKWEKILGTEKTFFDNNKGFHGEFKKIEETDYKEIENAGDNGTSNGELQNSRKNTFLSKNTIFYGPPGTGKTREAKNRAAEITGTGIDKVDDEIEETEGRIKLVQFHPSYSYFDFVEGIEAGEKGFELKSKVFKEFAERAKKALPSTLGTVSSATNSIEENNQNNDTDKSENDSNGDNQKKSDSGQNNESLNNNYVLIIDEINRANMASVFGELLYALEYRGKEIKTSGGSTLTVPDNLYIIGTMNTADVTIANMDYAVRRRFDFEKVLSHFPDGTFKCRSKTESTEYKVSGSDLTFESASKVYNIDTDWNYSENDNISSYEVGDKFFISNLYNIVRVDVEKSVAKGVNVEDIMPGPAYFFVNKNEKNKVDEGHLQYKIDYEIVPLLTEYAKNGLFSKRYKINNDKSLHEMVMNMEYAKRLKEWLKKLQ